MNDGEAEEENRDMSLMKCDNCGRIVDTDEDTACFQESFGGIDGRSEVVCLCEPCREESGDDE